MRKSIFEIENRVNVVDEYKRLRDLLLRENTILYKRKYYSLYELFDELVFPFWKYKDTFVEMEEFLSHIGVDIYNDYINMDSFLNFIEFLLNISSVTNDYIDSNSIKFIDNKINGIITHNCPLLLERMNYKSINDGDKIVLVKRDVDIDSIIDIVDEDVATLLLEYYDRRNDNLSSKESILKKLDKRIEEDEKYYKQNDKSLYDDIGFLTNKMGINHPIRKEAIKKLSDSEKLKWYDRCFKMMIHLIRNKEIKSYRKEIDVLKNED